MKRVKAILRKVFYRVPPKKFQKKFISLKNGELEEFEKFLKKTYYKNYTVFDQSDDLRRDVKDQLTDRLHKFREEVVPWLAHVKEINGARILEVGCGTGSSTVAFAEQGALVTALDVDADSLAVAEKRVSLYGLKAEFVLGNGQELGKLFSARRFDSIIFSATLEHMTYTERIASLRAAFELLGKGDHLVVVETPNRLWFYDFHTAFLPFYFWLPDELAFDYASRSKRKNFAELYKDKTPEQMLHFIRRGRGVSFHDFEISFDGLNSMKMISCMETFNKKKIFRLITDRLKSRDYLKYKKIIQKNGPAIHEGFYEPWLDLIFRKS